MAKIRMITIEKLLEMKANDEDFALVETLPKESFDNGHIPGAVNIPSDSIAQEAGDRLQKNATVVTYCANYACQASTVAAKKLMDLGYSDVLDFKAGKAAWKGAQLDLET